MNGEIVPGKLIVANGQGYVLDTDGTRTNIDLQQIDRVVQPGITLEPTQAPSSITDVS